MHLGRLSGDLSAIYASKFIPSFYINFLRLAYLEFALPCCLKCNSDRLAERGCALPHGLDAISHAPPAPHLPPFDARTCFPSRTVPSMRPQLSIES